MMIWNNVSLQKGGRPLLQNISVEIPVGQVTVILGPNGAGKSTFLKLSAKELAPSAGDITWLGLDLQSWSIQDLALFRGVLSQSHPIAFPMDPKELVKMGRYPHQARRSANAEDARIVDEAMDACKVQHLAERSTQFLSGGEMQRVHTARVLTQIWQNESQRPRMLLLDEPTASLDPAYQHLCLQNARAMADEGVCVLAILHDLNLAARYADRIIFLKEGRLVAEGPMRAMMKESLLQDVFAVDIHTVHDPRLSHPLIVTLGSGLNRAHKEPQLRSL
jgi:iron complex transport system ATP-binding protein